MWYDNNINEHTIKKGITVLEFLIITGSMFISVIVSAIMIYSIAPKNRLFSDASAMLLLCSAVMGALFPYHILPALS